MPPLDFPNSPANGTTYVGGLGAWLFDGAKWIPQSAQPGNTIYVPISGATMTGPLILSGDPTTALGAATKQYVDAHAGSGGAGIIVSATPPASPTQGEGWFDSVGGQFYISYNDGNSTQWVIANSAMGGVEMFQAGPGLHINTATSPPTIDVVTPYLPLTAGPTVPLTGRLVVNLNAAAVAALPTPPTGTGIRIIGTDTTSPILDIEAYGTGAYAEILGSAARGTGAAPAAIQTGDIISQFQVQSYDGTAWGYGGAIGFYAVDTWTTSDHNTEFKIGTIAASTGNARISVRGGLMVLTSGGALPVGGDLGPGCINAAGQIQANNYVITQGSSAAFEFGDRTAGTQWLWYGTGNIARLNHSTAGDLLTINSSGNTTVSGTITAGSDISATGVVHANGSLSSLLFQDRGTTTPVWQWYATGGIARLNNGTSGDAHMFYTNGNMTITGAITTAGANINGNIFLPNNTFIYGKDTGGTNRAMIGVNSYNNLVIGINGDLPTFVISAFYCAASDPGQQLTYSFFGNKRWRFAVSSGDDTAAGAIDYRGYDTGALSIVGAGTSGSNRWVHLWDWVQVNQGIQASNYIASQGTAAGLQFQDRAGGSAGSWVWYATGGIARLYWSASATDIIQVNATSGLITGVGGLTANGYVTSQGSNAAIQWTSRDNSSLNWLFWATNSWARFWRSDVGDMFLFVPSQFIPQANNVWLGSNTNPWLTVFSTNGVSTSDIRLKTALEDLPDCLPLVMRLNPQRFRWIGMKNPADPQPDVKHWGFVAQHVGEAFADHEFGGYIPSFGGGYEGISYQELTAVLWKAVQELSAKVARLEGAH